MRKAVIGYSLLALLLLGIAGTASGTLPAAAQQEQGTGPATPDSAPQNPPADQKLSLSDQVIRNVLEPLRTGMETQNIQLVLSVFDRKQLGSYSDLQAQLNAFFGYYDQINFRYQILQATADRDRGSVTAELEMDALPYEPTRVPSRRSVQMRFQIRLAPKGWKVVGFSPADFFSIGFSGSPGYKAR